MTIDWSTFLSATGGYLLSVVLHSICNRIKITHRRTKAWKQMADFQHRERTRQIEEKKVIQRAAAKTRTTEE